MSPASGAAGTALAGRRVAVGRLAGYEIHPVHGFVPARGAATTLDERYAPWERLASRLGVLLMSGRLHAAVEAMPTVSVDGLVGAAERERAFLLLSCLGGAYVHTAHGPEARVPAPLAVPWHELSVLLDRPPVLGYASIVLHNWRRLDPGAALTPANADTCATFLGGLDEKWFYLASLGVELAGAPALGLLVHAQHAVAAGNDDLLTTILRQVAAVITATTESMLAVKQQCDPYIYYHRVRPFLSGWAEPGVVYEGVDDEPRMFAGGSAAQSSLIQAFDAGLDVLHNDGMTAAFLTGMRAYMPVAHRAFLADLEAGPSVRGHVMAEAAGRPQLAEAYEACLDALRRLRDKHIGLAGHYIGRFTRNGRGEGTGGTDFTRLLRTSRDETLEARVGAA